MTWRHWLALAVAIGIVVGITTTKVLNQAAAASQSTSQFLETRDSVYSLLNDRLRAPFRGVTILLPAAPSAEGKVLNPFPEPSHIQQILREQAWQGSAMFQMLLELDESAMPASGEASSNTLAATVLLEHYFSELENLGLRRRGSPGVVMGKVQSSRNEWYSDEGQSITVQGTVFVAPDSKQAIVTVTVHERLAKPQ